MQDWLVTRQPNDRPGQPGPHRVPFDSDAPLRADDPQFAADPPAEHWTALEPGKHRDALAIAEMRAGRAYCYLAFFGLNGRCRFIKVGMSSHPEQRVYRMQTACPLDLLAIYACEFDSREQAFGVEQSLLRTLQPIVRRGEWIEVTEQGMAEISAIAAGMSSLIPGPEPFSFEPMAMPKVAA